MWQVLRCCILTLDSNNNPPVMKNESKNFHFNYFIVAYDKNQHHHANYDNNNSYSPVKIISNFCWKNGES